MGTQGETPDTAKESPTDYRASSRPYQGCITSTDWAGWREATYVTKQCFCGRQHNAPDLRRKRADFQHSRSRERAGRLMIGTFVSMIARAERHNCSCLRRYSFLK
jgi:hypothetical protein